MKLKRILLAEDNPLDVEMTLEALSGHGLANAIDVVNDGVEALDYLFRRGAFAERPEGNPGLLILDIKMPRMDGLQVLEQIKQSGSLRTMPVVMLTASRQEKDLLESYRLGVNAFVVKPVDFHEFADAMKVLGLFWAILNEPPPEGRG
jgi:two-component system, response regulator